MRLSRHAAFVGADAICALANGGTIKIFSGKLPVSVEEDSIGAQLLAECKLSPRAFKPSIDGLCAANPIAIDDNANASGEAAWCRVCDPSGAAIFDCESKELNMDNSYIMAGAKVVIDGDDAAEPPPRPLRARWMTPLCEKKKPS